MTHMTTIRRARAATRRPKDHAWTTTELLILAAVAAVVIAAALTPLLPNSPGSVPLTTVRVESADTLWSLAQAHPIEGLSTAETVSEIRRLNELPSSSLSAGSLLRVPARGDSGATAWASR